jgi:hypothetical protein
VRSTQDDAGCPVGLECFLARVHKHQVRIQLGVQALRVLAKVGVKSLTDLAAR